MAGLGRHVRALPQLQHRLLGGRPVAAGADDGHPVEVGGLRAHPGAPARPRAAASGCPRRGAPRVPPPRTCSWPCGSSSPPPPASTTITSSATSASGLSGFPGDEPDRAVEGLRRLERDARPAFVADADEQVGLRWREHRLKRLQRLAARLSGVVRGATAGEDDATLGEAAVADALRHGTQPLGLVVDRLECELAGHLVARR